MIKHFYLFIKALISIFIHQTKYHIRKVDYFPEFHKPNNVITLNFNVLSDMSRYLFGAFPYNDSLVVKLDNKEIYTVHYVYMIVHKARGKDWLRWLSCLFPKKVEAGFYIKVISNNAEYRENLKPFKTHFASLGNLSLDANPEEVIKNWFIDLNDQVFSFKTIEVTQSW